jgi:CheY-like chemotaxis protein
MQNFASHDRTGSHNRVLLVENDERALRYLEDIIRSEGFDLRTTWSGHEALALIQSQTFDLVLVDDHLPDIYYGEFVRLASRHNHSLVVMHSGKSLSGSLRRHRALGAAGVVDKNDPRQLRQLLLARHIRQTPGVGAN